MFGKIAEGLKRAWRAYSDFVRDSGLDGGNCRRCVPIIKHDPPLERGKPADKEGEDTLQA